MKSDRSAGVSGSAGEYFATIAQLTAKISPDAEVTTGMQKQPVSNASIVSHIEYAPYGVSIILFLSAFFLHMMNAKKTVKHIVYALLFGIVAAAIPAILTYVQIGSRQNIHAGPEETPRMIRVVHSNTKQVDVFWETDAPRIGMVRVMKEPFDMRSARVVIADNREPVKIHHAVIDGLSDGVAYGFELYSGSTWYDDNGAPVRFQVRSM